MGTVTREAYQKMVNEDLEWLRKQLPGSIERSHIEHIIRDSVDRYYGAKEKIAVAAIRSNGLTLTGAHHAQIIRYACRCLNLSFFNGEQGFLTNTNRFVDRAEAGRIAVEAGQVDGLKFHRTDLFSEELWVLRDEEQ